MVGRKGILVSTILCLACAGPDTPAQIGEAVDDFALREITAEGRLGGRHRLSDQRGSVVVVNVWATWCEPCIEEMPELEALARSYDGRVRFYGLTHDLRWKVGAFIRKREPSPIVHL